MTSPSPDEKTTDGLLACPNCKAEIVGNSIVMFGVHGRFCSIECADEYAAKTEQPALVINHDEALELAQMKQHESNLARAYIDLNRVLVDMAAFARIRGLEAEVDRLNTWSKTVWCESCQNTGYIDSDGTCGNCELGREKTRRRQAESALTLARAEAKALAFEECRQTVAQVFDDYRHLIQREFNEKYGGVDNLSGENFLGDAVDFAIRKIKEEGGKDAS